MPQLARCSKPQTRCGVKCDGRCRGQQPNPSQPHTAMRPGSSRHVAEPVEPDRPARPGRTVLGQRGRRRAGWPGGGPCEHKRRHSSRLNSMCLRETSEACRRAKTAEQVVSRAEQGQQDSGGARGPGPRQGPGRRGPRKGQPAQPLSLGCPAAHLDPTADCKQAFGLNKGFLCSQSRAQFSQETLSNSTGCCPFQLSQLLQDTTQ